jgi:uncharacterized membrane protein YdjX (TVP38/TMEM64 family)
MEKIIEDILLTISETYNPYVVALLSSFMIIIESIIPILPLAVFISFTMLVFGNFFGFIISWISTIIGCIISFYIFRNKFNHFFYKNIKEEHLSYRLVDKFNRIKLSNLVLLTALPFTPAFAINIASGLSKMEFKKFLLAISIAKISVVYFWGFVGTSLVDSLSDFNTILIIGMSLIVVYFVSEYIRKVMGVE